MNVHKWGVLELVLQSECHHRNSVGRVLAEFTGPSGQSVTVEAFWDGGRTWRIRFSPDEVGCWTWRTRVVGGTADGLERPAATFVCSAYEGANPLYRHGPLKLAASRRTLAHDDGTPFFWLADTAWNGVIRGDDNNWREYLGMRARQRFSVIQFVCSHWRGDALDEAGEPSYYEGHEGHPLRINPAFFQRVDRRVAMLNECGLVAAPVALWSLLQTDPGYKLAEEDAIRLAAYIVARYDAYQVVWLLGGDGNYQEIGIARWKRIGRAVFSVGHHRLASLHPCGQSWVGDAFGDEDWYAIIGYQSGHGDGQEHLQWLVKGPPATAWTSRAPHPVINMEPNYEAAHGYQHHTVFSADHVRRAAYWSLLISPMAGLTYGHDAIWNWNFTVGPSEGHGNWHGGAVPPWRTGLATPGIQCMSVLRGIVERIDWPTARPAQDLLAAQPGDQDIAGFIAASRTADGTIILYAPCGGTVRFQSAAPVSGPVRLVNPETGVATPPVDLAGHAIDLPGNRDWIVVCGKGWKE